MSLNLTGHDVVDMTDVKTWSGWCDLFYCVLCNQGPDTHNHEFAYSVNGGERRYVKNACGRCTRQILEHDPFFTSREQWQRCVAAGKNNYCHYVLYGLIDADKEVVCKGCSACRG